MQITNLPIYQIQTSGTIAKYSAAILKCAIDCDILVLIYSTLKNHPESSGHQNIVLIQLYDGSITCIDL